MFDHLGGSAGWCAGKVKRLAVDATLRSAAPYQKSRRERARQAGKQLKPVYVDSSDMRRCLPVSSSCVESDE